MNKTIVSIVSEQPIPNYLLIKEIFNPGDNLLFIASTKTESIIQHIIDTLHISAPITNIVLDAGDEERWTTMCQRIENELSHSNQYAVNLTGGTKYMALAVQSIFAKYDSTFYYIPHPKNVMLSSEKVIPISTRVNVSEFMELHGHKIKWGKIIRPFEDSQQFLYHYTHTLNKTDFEIINKLREYRDKNISIPDIENKDDDKKKPAIPGLSNFLYKINFVGEQKDNLTKYEVQYLTGGWFEEYVYHLIQTEIKPTDIKFGIKLNSTQNDLDVVFTKGNKLFVIECKTGVEKGSMLNQIVYKSSAIKEYLRGISAQSYIFALAKEDPEWTKIANHMGIPYYGKDHFLNADKQQELLNSIIIKSYD